MGDGIAMTNMAYIREPLLRLPEVLKIVPVSRATWYAGIKTGCYPAPINLGQRAVAWRRSEIEQFIASLGAR